MVRERLSKFAFYRYRYLLAYFIFAVALATMLIVAGLYLPGGLSDAEIRSAIISDNLSPANIFNLQPEQLLYLPYRLLQAGSISLLGFSIVSIKLPSIILGFVSALGILYLLNLWYHRNVAIVTATVAVTTSQFVLTAQAGQSGISYIFLTTMILIAASMIARRSAYAKLWVFAGFALAGISLYMPLNIYILLALVITTIIHPHARHLVFRESSRLTLAIGSILFLLIISPLAIGIFNDWTIIKILIGIPDTSTDIGTNVALLFNQYFEVYKPTSGSILTPVYGLGTMLLISLGTYRLITAKYTTKSYIITTWIVLLLPLICLNPSFISITFVPVVLLIALAVDYLIWAWYRLFPRNPYARVIGLLPLAVLLGGLIISSIDRYVYGFHYDKAVYDSYSYDLPILENKLRTFTKDHPVRLIVHKDNLALYTNYSKHQTIVSKLIVSTNTSEATVPGTSLVERTLVGQVDKVPDEIIVTRTSANADRFYLYKNQ